MTPEVQELFLERFPRYLFSLATWQESASHDTPPVPAPIPLEETDILYLVGLHGETVQRLSQQWLTQKTSRRLIVLEPMEGRIVHFLEGPHAKELLLQTQFELIHLPKGRGRGAILQELANRYPLKQIAFASGLSSFDRRDYQRIQLSLLKKTALTCAHSVERLHSHIPLSHLLHNAPHFHSAFYANKLKHAFHNIPAILCGAGPSLSQSIELLRAFEQKALIIAGGSAIAALSAQGILPHFAVAIDPNPDEWERLKQASAFNVPLLFSSRLFPSCLATCNGPLGYMRSGMAGIPELWLEEELGLTDPILGEPLSEQALSVTTLGAALAVHFGCNPIVLEGLDLAYTGNRRYADGVLSGSDVLPTKTSLQPIDQLIQKRDRRGAPIVSAVRWIFESTALSALAKKCPHVRWINSTSGGLPIKGIESMTLEEVSLLCRHKRDLRGMIHAAIQGAPMPAATQAIVSQKLEELHRSLQAVCAHLDILVKNEHPGQCALAECELKEELAVHILFFDIYKTLPQEGTAFWAAFRELAHRCLALWAS